MKILTSELSMDASRGHMDVTRLNIAGSSNNRLQLSDQDKPFKLNLPFESSFRAESFSKQTMVSSMHSSSKVTNADGEVNHVDSGERLLEVMIEKVTGRGSVVAAEQEPAPPERQPVFGRSRAGDVARKYYRVGGQPFQLNLGVDVTRVEQDYLDVSTSGHVTTADGRDISFNMQFSMESRSVSRDSLAFGNLNGLFVDPLVLNFGSGLEMLSESTSFTFDLDCDGENEELCGLKPGSGFLALDLDGNKEVTNGSELFGPLTGAGFEELAVYDDDGNNWIDENDSIFNELLIWMNAGSSDASLVSLKEAGVGAISLQHVNSGDFNLKAGDGRVLGQIAASGIFLTEKGEVKSLQELDLAVPTDDENLVGGIGDSLFKREDSDLFLALRQRLTRHKEFMIASLDKQKHAKQDEEIQQSWLENKFWEWQEKKDLLV